MNKQRFQGFTAEASLHKSIGSSVARPVGASFSLGYERIRPAQLFVDAVHPIATVVQRPVAVVV
jgi:hypothetical protein